MNTIPSKYHSQIKKMIKKEREKLIEEFEVKLMLKGLQGFKMILEEREAQKAEIIKMIEGKKRTNEDIYSQTPQNCNYDQALDDIIKEIKKL